MRLSLLLLGAWLPLCSSFLSVAPAGSLTRPASAARSSPLRKKGSLPLGRRPQHRGAASAQGWRAMAEIDSDLFTPEEVEKAAEESGLTISFNSIGPYYRAVIRTLPKEGEEKGVAVGFTTGWITGSLLRQDTMRVSAVNTGNELSKGRIQKLKAERQWRVPTLFGISLLLGAYVMALAYQKGCTTCELLAVKDDDKQHSILKRHYRRLGLEIVKEVNNDIDCALDRIVWGGEGCLMRAEVTKIMGRHTAAIKKMGQGLIPEA